MGRRVAAGAIALMLAACGGLDDDPRATLLPSECRFPLLRMQRDTTDLRCGVLAVPELRSDDQSDLIHLPWAMFMPTRGRGRERAPLIYLEGGPGGSSIDFALTIDGTRLSRLERPVIAFEQRGAPLANPALECFDSGPPLVGPCRQFYKERGIRLEGYNLAESARDVCSLIELLGPDQVSLLGVSFGTVLGQEVMRTCPERLHSVWLDGVVPADSPWSVGLAANFQSALDQVFSACAADTDCNAAYPNLALLFATVLSQTPAVIDPAVGFDRDTLIRFIFDGFYSPEFIPAVPGLIYAIRDGRVQAFLDEWLLWLISPAGPQTGGRQVASTFAGGAFFAMSCNEDFQYFDLTQYDAVSTMVHPAIAAYFREILRASKDECDQWPRRPLIPKLAVHSDVPTLVTSGGFDPITPASGARRVAASLSNATFLEFPALSHGLIYDPCPEQIWLSFLRAPGSQLDSSCIAQRPVRFFIEPRL